MDPALEKLRAALEDYLQLGAGTPVADQAQALMQTIDQSGGAGGDMGGGPGLDQLAGMGDMGSSPDMGGAPPPPDQGAPPPDMGAMDLSGGAPTDQMPPPGDSKTFAGANAGATDRLKKLNKKSKA